MEEGGAGCDIQMFSPRQVIQYFTPKHLIQHFTPKGSSFTFSNKHNAFRCSRFCVQIFFLSPCDHKLSTVILSFHGLNYLGGGVKLSTNWHPQNVTIYCSIQLSASMVACILKKEVDQGCHIQLFCHPPPPPTHTWHTHNIIKHQTKWIMNLHCYHSRISTKVYKFAHSKYTNIISNISTFTNKNIEWMGQLIFEILSNKDPCSPM